MERLRAHRGGNAGASTSTHVANMGASSVCVSAARKQGAVRAAWAGGEGAAAEGDQGGGFLHAQWILVVLIGRNVREPNARLTPPREEKIVARSIAFSAQSVNPNTQIYTRGRDSAARARPRRHRGKLWTSGQYALPRGLHVVSRCARRPRKVVGQCVPRATRDSRPAQCVTLPAIS